MKFLNHRWAIFGILLLGIVIRIVALLLIADAPLLSDAGRYRWSAFYHYTGRSMFLYWPPGLPLYISLMYDIFNDTSEIISQAGMIFFYLASGLFLYLLIKEIVSRWAANLATLIFTFFPAYIYHSVSPLTHFPMACALLIIVYLIYRLLHHRSTWWLDFPIVLILGGTAGYAVLIRASSIAILPVIPLYLILVGRRYAPAILSTIIALCIFGMYIADVSKQQGHFVFINYANSYNLFVGNSETTPFYRTWLYASDKDARTPEFNTMFDTIEAQPPSKRDSLYQEAVIRHIIERPDLFIIRTLSRIRAYFGFDTFSGTRLIAENIVPTIVGLVIIGMDGLFYIVIMLTALVYIIAYWNIWGQIPVLLIASIVLLYSAPYFVVFSHPTYHLPITPLLSIFSVALFDKLRQTHTRKQLFNSIGQHRFALSITLILFTLIQVEWTIVMIGEFLDS